MADPEHDPGQTKRAEGGFATVWRRALLTHRGYLELNRATHGAFGFNTAAKALAWGGLCAIVLLLLHKVHQIQVQLDPVGQGIEQLREELRSASTTVETGTQASGKELGALRAKAQQLSAVLEKANTAQKQDAAPALLRAQAEAHELEEALGKETEALQTVAAQRDQLAKSLGNFQQAVEQGQRAAAAQAQLLADGGAVADSSLRLLSDAARASSAKVGEATERLQFDKLSERVDSLVESLAALQREVDQRRKALEAAPLPSPRKQVLAASPPAADSE